MREVKVQGSGIRVQGAPGGTPKVRRAKVLVKIRWASRPMDDETWASRLVKGGAVCGGYLGRVWDVLYGLLYGSKESVVHTLVFSVSPLADPGADPGTVPRDAVARRRGAAPRAVPEPVAPMRRFGLGTVVPAPGTSVRRKRRGKGALIFSASPSTEEACAVDRGRRAALLPCVRRMSGGAAAGGRGRGRPKGPLTAGFGTLRHPGIYAPRRPGVGRGCPLLAARRRWRRVCVAGAGGRNGTGAAVGRM